MFHMGTGAVTWSLKKQYIIVLSSTEVEYITQTHAVKEVMYLCTFVWEIHGLDKLVMLNCDNQGAIALLKDNKFHMQTKHLDICYHFIQEAVKNGKIMVIYVPTDENPADIFTNPLTKARFHCFVELLRLKDFDMNR